MRLAVLASGTGSILEAMLESGLAVELVVVDRPCRAIEVARTWDVDVRLVERSSFGVDFDRDAYTEQIVDELRGADIELVAMAGFGTILGAAMYRELDGRVLNTHPSLLPAFPGWHAVEAALEHGVKVTGCTVHVATLEVDAGPIVAQVPVEVHPDDTPETLHERIKGVERKLYIDTIRTILEKGTVPA